MLAFCEQLYSQMSHLNAFFPSWTAAICSVKAYLVVKFFSQISHLNGFFFSWTAAMCLTKLQFLTKFSHFNSFFPSCMHEMCEFKLLLWMNWELQISHLKDLFFTVSILSNYFFFNGLSPLITNHKMNILLWFKCKKGYTCCLLFNIVFNK